MEISSNWLDFAVVGAYLGITLIVTLGVFTSGKKR